jgi:hypothetical protein
MIGARSRSLASTVRFASLLVLATSTATLAACGGAAGERAPAAKSPSNVPVSEPSSVEEAQEQIAAAKADLARASAGGVSGSSSLAPSLAPPAADSSTAEPSAVPKAPSRPGASESSKSARTADDRCSMPCRALTSMRTAVTALCRMTGNDDARCADAKRTLADSEGRIAPCSC